MFLCPHTHSACSDRSAVFVTLLFSTSFVQEFLASPGCPWGVLAILGFLWILLTLPVMQENVAINCTAMLVTIPLHERSYLSNQTQQIDMAAWLVDGTESKSGWKLLNHHIHFKNRGLVQTRSLFFQMLPAELRHMIYKEVLKHDKPLSSGVSGDTAEFFREACTILLTCQQMLDEAIPVLFRENTMEICVDSQGRYSILRNFFQLPASWDEAYKGAGILSRYGNRVPMNLLNATMNLDSWTHSKSIVGRFRSFKLTINTDSPFDIYFACATLGEQVLSSKNVVLSLPDVPKNQSEAARVEQRSRMLKACQALRCRKFKLAGGVMPKKLKKVIEGKRLDFDQHPFPLLYDFNKYLDMTIPASYHRSRFLNDRQQELTTLHEALLLSDMNVFIEHLSDLYTAAKDEAMDRVQQQEADAQTRIEASFFEMDWSADGSADTEDESEEVFS